MIEKREATPPASLHLGVTPWADGSTEPTGPGLLQQARLAESLGFDSFFLPESHLHEGARPAPLVALAAIAGATDTLRLGTTSLLLPLRDPLLLAEEIASLDQLSTGRLVLGLGRGFRKATFSAFGVDVRSKRDLFESVLATMLRAWGVEPDWPEAPEGPDSGATRVAPLPFQRPHPPLWVAAFGPKAIEQAARLRLPYLASPIESLETVEANLASYRSLHAERIEVPLMRTVFVSDDVDECDRVATDLRAEREALARSRPALTGGDPDLASYALIGDQTSVLGQLRALRDRLAPTHLIARTPTAVEPQRAERSLRQLADLVPEVTPAESRLGAEAPPRERLREP